MAEYSDKHRDRRFDDGDFWHLPKPERRESEPRADRPIDLPAVRADGDDRSAPAFAIPERKEAPTGSSTGAAGKQFPNVFIRQSYAGRGGRRQTTTAAPRTARGTPAEADLITSYEPDNVLLHKISVYRWPNQYHFYEKFIRNAHLSHAAVGHECPRVPFFSYIPQYSQLTRGQAHYYFWFRDNAREGRYLDADISYVLLYVYEIINLPDEIETQSGAVLLCRLWNAYRGQHRELDKYLSEWLADYCLIHAIPLPEEAKPLVPVAVRCSTLPEFYFAAGMTENNLAGFSAALIAAASDYDYKTSRYYDGCKSDFDTAIPAAVTAAVTAMREAAAGIFSPDATKTIKQSRDAFCGSLCEHNVKRRIDIELSSFARSHGLRAAVTATVKYAENRLRIALRLKSRLAATGLPDDARRAIDVYFAAAYPDSVRSGDVPPAYEAYYDTPDVPLSPEMAREIEERSWKMTALLDGTERLPDVLPAEGEPLPTEDNFLPTGADGADELPTPGDEPDGAITFDAAETPRSDKETDGDTFDFFLRSDKPTEAPDAAGNDPDSLLGAAVRAVLSGEGLCAFCHERALFPDEVASRINEYFYDTVGDVVLEASGGDWSLIEDYREDVERWSNT